MIPFKNKFKRAVWAWHFYLAVMLHCNNIYVKALMVFGKLIIKIILLYLFIRELCKVYFFCALHKKSLTEQFVSL